MDDKKNEFKVNDKYYRIIKRKPYAEFKVDNCNSWSSYNLVVAEYRIVKDCGHYYEGESEFGLDKVIKLPISPMKVMSYLVCEDCVDYDVSSIEDKDLYNAIENFIFSDRNEALKVFNRVLKYKIKTLEDFKKEHDIDANYPF